MDVSFLPATDILILSVPFLLILAMWMFRLDTLFANPARTSTPRRVFCEVEGNGIPFLSDPDGRAWQTPATPTPDELPASSPRSPLPGAGAPASNGRPPHLPHRVVIRC